MGTLFCTLRIRFCCNGAPRLFAVVGLLTAMVLVVPGHARYAQWLTDFTGQNSGTSTCAFLNLPMGAVELSRGVSWSPKYPQPSFLPLNPALSAFDTYRKASLTHLEWLMGLRTEFAAGYVPVPRVGTFGAYSRVFTAGTFDYARDIDQKPSSPSYVEYSLSTSFARELMHDRLAAGGSVSYVESRLDKTAGRTATLDLGAAYRENRFRAHGTVRNLSPGITYVATRERLPVQLALAAEVEPFTDRLILDRRLQADIGVGLRKNGDEPVQVGAGADLTFLDALHVRAAYDYSLGQKRSAAGLSAGIGVSADRFTADFGWRNQSRELGSVWALSASMSFDEIQPKTALDYYKQAQRHYDNGRTRPALGYARKAIRLDPNLWRAHSLIARINAENRRAAGREFALIYTGDSRGQMVPFIRADETLGGLARQAAAVAEYRSRFPTSIAVNTGNNLSRTTHPLRAELLGYYLSAVSFDALIAGGGEFGYSLDRFTRDTNLGRQKLINTNAHARVPPSIIQRKIITAHRYKIMIASYVNPKVVDPNPPGLFTHQDSSVTSRRALAQTFLDDQAKDCDIRVLVMQDSWANISSFAQSDAPVDVIIAVGISQRFATPMRKGSTLILSPGDLGQAVGALSFQFDKSGKRIGWDHVLAALTDGSPYDRDIDLKAQRIALQVALDKAGIPADSLSAGKIDGTLLFLSDRKGTPHLYLKAIRRLGEYPIATGAHISDPKISFDCGKVLFFAHDSTGDSTLVSMNILGAERRELAEEFDIWDVSFTPDGAWVYAGVREKATGKSGIIRITSDGVAPNWVVQFENAMCTDLAFSPDEKHMVFTTDRDRSRQVYLCSTEGERPIRLTDARANHGSAQFGPNGRYVAYLSDRASLRDRMDLWYYDMTTGRVGQLTHHARVQSFCWLPDGRGLVYAAEKPAPQLFRVDLDQTNGGSPLIAPDSSSFFKEHSPRLMSYKGKKKIVYVREYASGEQEIRWVHPEGAGDHAIVRSKGNDWLE